MGHKRVSNHPGGFLLVELEVQSSKEEYVLHSQGTDPGGSVLPMVEGVALSEPYIYMIGNEIANGGI